MRADWSNDYVGIPYKLHGREIDGLDCWGLVRQVYARELRILLPSYEESYFSTLDEEGFQEAFGNESLDWIPVTSTLREFDAVWCRIAGVECHVGVYVGSGKMVHAMLGNDSCLVSIDSTAWERRIVQCYRHRSL